MENAIGETGKTIMLFKVLRGGVPFALSAPSANILKFVPEISLIYKLGMCWGLALAPGESGGNWC